MRFYYLFLTKITTIPIPIMAPTPIAIGLYRIIGVFNGRVKLIKADYVTSGILGVDGRDYYGMYEEGDWNSTSYYRGNMDTSTIAAYRWNYDTSISENGSNNWTTSELNIINLNKNYLNNFGSWADLIGETTWYVGGINQNELSLANSYYEAERDNTDLITYYAKIGLMYQSDYGYAASPDYWINSLNSYDTVVDYNWMYMGLDEWTITPHTSSNGYLEFADYVDSRGRVTNTYAMFGFAIRPVFYLQSSVLYSSGDGSIDNPYRIEI